MRYNAKYDKWISKDGVVLREDKKTGYLTPCCITVGCIRVKYQYLKYGHRGSCSVHRAVWETFNGPIPKGMEIDHIDGDSFNNKLSNLKLVTHAENTRNPISVRRTSAAMQKTSEFGREFYRHFGMLRMDDPALYDRERAWWSRHKQFRWEVADDAA